ncbi:MAG TPA: ABC transporter ATP-binding protein [Clostridia bacterium]|nr:ABC transporter ATP-binding protein [Clostridia bacterium]
MTLFRKLLSARKGLAALTVLGSLISIGLSLNWNARLSLLIDAVSVGAAVPGAALAAVLGIMLASAAAAYTLDLLSGWTCETLAHDLRMSYARHFAALSLLEVEALNAGEQLSMLQNEIQEISAFLRANLSSLIHDLIKFVGTFAWLLWLNPSLTLLSNAPVALLLIYTAYSSRIIGQAAQESQQANQDMNGFADTLVSVFPVLRLFEAGPLLRGRYGAALDRWEGAVIREERRKARLMSLSAFLSYSPLLMLFLVGGTQVLRGTATLGMLYIFLNLSGNVSGVMMNLPGRIGQFRRFEANLRRLGPSILLDEGRRVA